MQRRAGILVGILVVIVTAAATSPAPGATRDGGYYLGYHEPTAGSPTRQGIVLTLHGGGWEGNLGSAADEVMEPYIDDLNGWGYPVFNLGYQSGRQSLRDTLDAVRRLHRSYPGRPLCVLGGSAGAHLALMAAIKAPKEVDCVVDIGGPPSLERPDSQPGSAEVPRLAAAVFGAKRLRNLSPIRRVKDILAPVLVVAPECDYFTSPHRQQRFVDRLRRGRIVIEEAMPDLEPPRNLLQAVLQILRPHGVETGHCEVTKQAFEAFRQAEYLFLEEKLG